MLNNYDPIARNYDWLSRLIFRKSLILSQTCLLQHIPPGSNVLIVGGGTGWILEEIAKIHPSGLSITYVEISEKMIDLARKRDIKENQVIFVNKAIENYGDLSKYDIILTAFLFDNFSPEKAGKVFGGLARVLKKEGKWLFADFHIAQNNGRWWQALLLKTMLAFFRMLCNIEAKDLAPMASIFRKNGFNEVFSYYHFSRFIKSSVFIRI